MFIIDTHIPNGSNKRVKVEQSPSGVYLTDEATGQRRFVTVTALTLIANLPVESTSLTDRLL